MAVDFNREVYAILGLPFDAVNTEEAARRVRNAVAERRSCFLSTPNVNWAIACLTDRDFRYSVQLSDLSIADGMPIVWIARALNIPIRERVAGSTVFEVIRGGHGKPISVYFFGGPDGAAEAACRTIEDEKRGMTCAGYASPGFGSIEEMSTDAIIQRINASQADFLVIALGARKGQAWIEHNRQRLRVPVFSHLGAVVNFVAGTARRAPVWVRNLGLEWVWRIWEEPTLFRRYWLDGIALLRLMATRVLPHAWFMFRHKHTPATPGTAALETQEEDGEIVIRLSGAWTRHNLQPLRDCLSRVAPAGRSMRFQMEGVTYVDCAFIGLLMLLHGEQRQQGKSMALEGVPTVVGTLFRHSCAEFLIQ